MDLKISDCRIRKVVEIERLEIPAKLIFADFKAELYSYARTRLDPRLLGAQDGSIAVSFHSYLVQTVGINILVDTCHGNHKPRQGIAAMGNHLDTDYLGGLSKLGMRREDIDVVFCTHLHYDHVGWNTMLDNGLWVPTFPRARYLISRKDYDHFNVVSKHNPAFPGIECIRDSVTPVVEAGLAEFVDPGDGFELGRDLWFEAAPGHTPGCANLHIGRNGARAVFSGDVIHHAIQMLDPRLHVNDEFDSELGYSSRMHLLNYCAGEDVVLLTGHFPTPTGGRVSAGGGTGNAYDFEFINA